MNAMILNLIAIVMMTLVGGIVLWLHRKIDIMRESAEKLPLLTGKLTQALSLAQREMLQLKHNVQKTEPLVSSQFAKAEETQQDLKFLISHAEKVLDRLEAKFAEVQAYEKRHGGLAQTVGQTAQPTATASAPAPRPPVAQQPAPTATAVKPAADLNLPRNVEGAVIRQEALALTKPMPQQPSLLQKEGVAPVKKPATAPVAEIPPRRRIVSRGEAALRQLAGER